MRALAIGALLLCVGLVAGREGLRRNDAPPEAPRAAPEAGTPPPVMVSDLAADLARARGAHDAAGVPDIFSPRAAPSAAQGNTRAAARKPSAPPLPFAFLGRIVDEGRTTVFVGNDSENFIPVPGEKVAAYRIESVGASSVTFVHLPTGTRQVLALPAPE